MFLNRPERICYRRNSKNWPVIDLFFSVILVDQMIIGVMACVPQIKKLLLCYYPKGTYCTTGIKKYPTSARVLIMNMYYAISFSV